MIYVGLSTHYSRAKDIVDDILTQSIKPLGYSLQGIASGYSIDLHTKKKLQYESNWNRAVEHIQSDLSKLTDDVIITEKINNAFLSETLPDCIRFIATSKKLDAVLSLNHKLNLSYEFTEEYFDSKINSLLNTPIIFSTENNWQQLGELLNIDTPQPFYVIKKMIVDGYSLQQSWAEIKQLYSSISYEKTQRIIDSGVHVFDLDCIFNNDPEPYKRFCSDLNIHYNPHAFNSIVQDFHNKKYMRSINTIYGEFHK